ncbi:unnamed protein product [Rotaria sp. Silwood1]|nr:unnamed protein product [Rotaria sp. Silwood1]
MGYFNVPMRETGLTSYGTTYNPYYDYGEIENYGSHYQPIAVEYPSYHGTTGKPLTTTVRSPLGGLDILGQQGLGKYENIYPTFFNSMSQLDLNRPKVRLIYVPNHVLCAFQNLLPQGGVGFANSFMGSFNPSMSGYGTFGMQQMMPMLQGSMSQIGSNCWSTSFQVPSMGPQYPFGIPCPPPMIQPAIPQMPMPYPSFMPQMSIGTPSMGYTPQVFPMIPQQQIYPQGISSNFSGIPFYGGFGQGLPLCGSLNNYSGFPNMGGNILANSSGMSQPGFGQSVLAGYSGFGQSPYGVYEQPGLGGYNQYGFSAYCQPGFASYGQQPFGRFNQLGLCGLPQVQPQFGNINAQQLSYNVFPQQSYNYYPGANINLSSGLSPINGLFQSGICSSVSNFSPISHAQLGSFPGSSGRISIVCCIIPQ